MKKLNNYFVFSFKRIFVSCICFIALFFIVTNFLNLPVTGSTNFKTKENRITMEITEPVSDNNIIIQSIFSISQ